MKQLILLVSFAILTSASAYACTCLSVTFGEELQRSEQIFTGTVVKKTEKGNAYFLFKIKAVYKGEIKDSITISTPVSSAACGVNFEVGKTYLVYAVNNNTNNCRRNALAKNNEDLLKLRLISYNQRKDRHRRTDSLQLSETESAHLNRALDKKRGNFDFTQKKVAFAVNRSYVGKHLYFGRRGDQFKATSLVILTENEKQQTGGYDAVVILHNTSHQKKKYRSQMYKRRHH